MKLHLGTSHLFFSHMVSALFEYPLLSILAFLVLSSILALHALLFKEYINQERVQLKRIREMERLVGIELGRSRVVENQIEHLDQIKSQTAEKLELIKLQVAAMKSLEKSANKDQKT